MELFLKASHGNHSFWNSGSPAAETYLRKSGSVVLFAGVMVDYPAGSEGGGDAGLVNDREAPTRPIAREKRSWTRSVLLKRGDRNHHPSRGGTGAAEVSHLLMK